MRLTLFSLHRPNRSSTSSPLSTANRRTSSPAPLPPRPRRTLLSPSSPPLPLPQQLKSSCSGSLRKPSLTKPSTVTSALSRGTSPFLLAFSTSSTKTSFSRRRRRTSPLLPSRSPSASPFGRSGSSEATSPNRRMPSTAQRTSLSLSSSYRGTLSPSDGFCKNRASTLVGRSSSSRRTTAYSRREKTAGAGSGCWRSPFKVVYRFVRSPALLLGRTD
jgi:hypothetical protein